MSEKQSTKAVYSTKEKALLVSLVETFKDKLESKRTDGTTNAIKSETWNTIANQYNTHDVTIRTPGQLKKCWENVKYKTRKADTQVRHNMLLTGGGPPEKDTSDVVDDMVRAIVPTINYMVTNTWDSTGIVELDQIKDRDISSPSTSQVVFCEETENVVQTTAQSARLIKENISNTPNKIEDRDPKFSLKRKRLSVVDEEKELRLRKLRESIEQQTILHQLRMETVEAEKSYWMERKKLLTREN